MFRVFVILIAFILALVIYQFLIKKILIKKCYLKTKTCARFEYYKYENSVFIHTIPTGYWIWFNGKKIFIYGDNTGRSCEDAGYEPVYMINPSDKQDSFQYVCVQDRESVLKFYNNKNVKKQYLFYRCEKDWNVYDIMAYFDQKNIINLRS